MNYLYLDIDRHVIITSNNLSVCQAYSVVTYLQNFCPVLGE